MNSTRLYIHGPNGKAWGYIEHGIFVKPWGRRSEHKLRKLNGWGLDADSYDKVIRPACHTIVIFDNDTGLRYKTTVGNFDQYRGEVDYGHGRQYFMILDHWTVVK